MQGEKKTDFEVEACLHRSKFSLRSNEMCTACGTLNDNCLVSEGQDPININVLFIHVKLITKLKSVIMAFFTNLMHSFFILIHLLYRSTCFKHYCAHLQEVVLYNYSIWSCHYL